MDEKMCKECKKVKRVSEFNKSKNIKDGYENKCKVCRHNARKKHKLTCSKCKKIFYSAKKKSLYCSISCSSESKKIHVFRECSYCGRQVNVVPSKAKKQDIFYCNQNCRTEHLKLTMLGENNPNYLREEHNCDGCDKPIQVIPSKLKVQKYVFCSNVCYKENIGRYITGEKNPNYNHQEFTCQECNTTFVRIPSLIGENNYCSSECYHKGRTGKIKKKINVPCSICGKQVLVWESRLKYSKYLHCSRECVSKGITLRYSGENSPSWNNELSYEERIINRKYPEYIEWREKVFQRDEFTCQACGDNKGGNLVAHHILNYSEHDHLRIEISNGITLCNICHKAFHDLYGYRNNTLEELEEFLK